MDEERLQTDFGNQKSFLISSLLYSCYKFGYAVNFSNLNVIYSDFHQCLWRLSNFNGKLREFQYKSVQHFRVAVGRQRGCEAFLSVFANRWNKQLLLHQHFQLSPVCFSCSLIFLKTIDDISSEKHVFDSERQAGVADSLSYSSTIIMWKAFSTSDAKAILNHVGMESS